MEIPTHIRVGDREFIFVSCIGATSDHFQAWVRFDRDQRTLFVGDQLVKPGLYAVDPLTRESPVRRVNAATNKLMLKKGLPKFTNKTKINDPAVPHLLLH